MKYNLTDTTFIIPVRIDSSDRLRNLFLSVSYILKNFDTNIIIKESDKSSTVLEKIPFLIESNKNIKYIFEQTRENHFHRTRILNDMILQTTTNIVVNYDADIILPIESYINSVDLIRNGSDVVYPFRHGVFGEKKIEFKDTENYLENPNKLNEHKFILNNLQLSNIENFCFYTSHVFGYGYADFGMCQFFKKQSYIDGFLENENFISYAPEDKERYYRFKTLGFKINRIENEAYHIEHSRNHNSSVLNPFMQHNNNLWNILGSYNKEQIKNYYIQQKFYIERISLINSNKFLKQMKKTIE
jgi:hypothetical protein